MHHNAQTRVTQIPGMPEGQRCISGQRYLFHLAAVDEHEVWRIARTYNMSFPAAHVLLARGFSSDRDITSFLFTTFEQDVHDPALLLGCDVASKRIEHAIRNKEKILIFGDYDVDGISSTALLMAGLLPLGAQINFFLPNRARDGYGLSLDVVKKAAASNYTLLITVDNGITAIKPAAEARKLGIDVIITDHHRQQDVLPEAYAILNPNQHGCMYPNKGLPGAGVAFKLLWHLYHKQGKELPRKAYELLTLGIIADVMPLLGENRFWVRHGLHHINTQKSYALSVLAHNNRLNKTRWSSLDIGFMIAPQLNALGRLSDPRDGVKFLISSKKEDVDRIGKVLFELNEARKKVERSIIDEIESAIVARHINLEEENVIMAASQKWPGGVIGLVAGRLVHQYGKPSLLFHHTKDGLLKGSCRSIPEFNIFDALKENEELLETFGGHSFAAGLSLKAENSAELKRRLEEKIARELTPYDLTQKREIDAELTLGDMGKKLISDLQQLEPFGHDNPQPLFLIRDVTLLDPPKLLKDKHLKCVVFADGVIKPVIFFNRPELYTLLQPLHGRVFDIVGNVTLNEWNGKESVELLGVDVIVPPHF